MRHRLIMLAVLLTIGGPAWAQMIPPLQMSQGPMMEPPPAKRREAPALAVQGKIKNLDPWSKTMTLEDGTTLRISESVATTALKEGARVIATYEEKRGQKVATSVIRVRTSSTS